MNISEVSSKMNIPVSTLRYYESEGLLQNIKRQSGIRDYSQNDIEQIRVIQCLKNSGLRIKDIKKFMQWCEEGDSTLSKRLELFDKREVEIKKKIDELNNALNMIQFKKWYYKTAVKDSTDKNVKEMIVTHTLPLDIKKLYEKTHE